MRFRSSCGRASSCPPRPTPSRRIAGRTNRLTARRRYSNVAQSSRRAPHYPTRTYSSSRKTTSRTTPCQPFARQRRSAQILRLAANKAVGAILFDDVSAINDLGDSIAVARSDRAHSAGFDGTGIRVAVWEDGPSVTTNLTFAGRFTTTPSASNHARLTSAGRQEHRSQQAPRTRAGLRPVLRERVRGRRAAMGRARSALHRGEPKLSSEHRARRLRASVGRLAQGHGWRCVGPIRPSFKQPATSGRTDPDGFRRRKMSL